MWRLSVRQPSRMSQQMHSFDVINLDASQSLLPLLVKAEIIVFEGNQTLLEKSRVVMWPEIGCLIHDVILRVRIFFFFRRFRKIAETNFYLRRVCPSVCPHGTTQLPPEGFSWNLIFENFQKYIKRREEESDYWGELKKNKVCGKSFKSVVKGSEVKWKSSKSVKKWSEVKWSEVKWREVLWSAA